MSVSDLLKTISTTFDNKNIAKDGKTYLPVKYKDGNDTKTLKVIKVAQNKYLWKNDNACEYAVRIIGLDTTETYTAVGYHGSNLSTEIKTDTYTKG